MTHPPRSTSATSPPAAVRRRGPAADASPRTPLTRQRVLEAAIALADEAGLEALSMRRLAQGLGVEAMSLYHHVSSKDDLLAGIIDLVVGEFELPDPGVPWKAAIRRTAISAHDTLVRHRWAANLMLTGGVRPARLRYMDALLGALRAGGFSADMTHHAYHALDSHILGFTLWQVGITSVSASLPDLASGFLRQLSTGEYPWLAEHVEQHVADRPADQSEFEFGLDLILEGLERHLVASAG